MPSALRNTAAKIVERIRLSGHEAFFVGGCVRDIVRGVEPADYDIVTSARPEQIREIFPRTVPLGIRFGIVLVVEEGHNFEVATYRADDAYIDGRRPSRIRYATAEEDVRRRDFTVNSLLMDPQTGRITDLTGGLRDIDERVIRTIGNPLHRFAEDHLRMLRAVRLAANLGFTIEQSTMEAIREKRACIALISAERVREELSRLLTGGKAGRGMELLDESGLLAVILPEVSAVKGIEQPARYHPEGDVWEHTLRMLTLLPLGEGGADLRLAWAVLLHDVGKAVTRSEDPAGVHFYGHVQKGAEIAGRIMDRLRFSRSDRDTVLELISSHMRFMHVRDMRPGTLKRFLRMPGFDLHLELHRLDCLGSHGMLDNHEFCLGKLNEIPAEKLHPARLLTGDDLIAMGFSPGPGMGRILKMVEEAQLNGEITTAEEARKLVLRLEGTKK